MNRQFLKWSSESVGTVRLLDFTSGRCSVKERLEEAQQLLIFICIDSSIVVENSKQDWKYKSHRWSLEDQEIVVFIEENHLVEESLSLSDFHDGS